MAAQGFEKQNDPISVAAGVGRNRKSFLSFGDKGLTASVGATGRLLRITQHFLGEKTGICLDDKRMLEPYYVSRRLADFLDRSLDESLGGIGPSIDALCSGRETEQDIVNNRWPTFTRPLRGDTSNKLRVSYMVFRGSEAKELTMKILQTLSLDTEVLIRDLDFVDGNNPFNEALSQTGSDESEVQTYTTCIAEGKTNNHVRWEHHSRKKHFVLHIHVLDQNSTTEFVKPDSKAEKSCYAPKSSYDLPDWKMFVEADGLIRRHKTVHLTNNHIIDSFLTRNLEYILSVCSIPVSEPDAEGIPAVALTCGDVDGHRVATAASFYAFQLLLLGMDRLKILHANLEKQHCTCDRDNMPIPSTAHPICMMKWRIERVCKGHMKWIFEKAISPKNQFRQFCPNHWTNGDDIDGWESSEWLPGKSLVDAPLQFLKAADFYKKLGKDMPEEPLRTARTAYMSWIRDLEKVEKSRKYAFPSYKPSDDRKPTKTFYLTDHALIWQAVKSWESTKLQSASVGGPENAGRYSANRLRENIVQRFATENPFLKNRMVAVKRSPTQTRFLLRSKDVALFRAKEEGLFKKTDTQWTNTLDCQKHHEGNDDTDWSDPRRFALAITMVQHGKLINFRTREELIDQALSALLSNSSFNGLFTGTYDERPGPATHEDNYATVIFEVPYILWKDYCPRVHGNPGDGTRRILDSQESRLKLMSQPIEGASNHLGNLKVHPAGPTEGRYHNDYWMKHNLPFNNVINDSNIVDLQDEWLYNEPAFFVNITNDGMGGHSDANANTNTEASSTANAHSANVRIMIDIPEHKPLKDKRPVGSLQVHDFPHDKENNSSCINTFAPNEEGEKAEMEQFFHRHKASSNFFTEETIAANTWTTGFHMAFFSAMDTHEMARQIIWHVERVAMGFRFEGDFFDRYWTCRFVVAEEEAKRNLIEFLQQDHMDQTQGSCEVKTGPWEQRKVLELMLFGSIIRRMAKSAGDILELAEGTVRDQKHRLDRRLDRLQRFQDSMGYQLPTSDDDSPVDYRSFLLTRNEFRKFLAHLQTIHGDFAKAMAIINHWLNRENDRQAERPRWTFKDESRYRSVLNKLLVTNLRGIQDLERNLTEMSNLAESIAKQLEYLSSHLEVMVNNQTQRNAEAIKLFTNTTAIFLPLGFATGMFSMSGTPDVQTVGRMFGLFGGVFIVGTLTILLVTKVNVNFAALIRRAWEELTRRAQARAPEDHERALWETRRNNARRTN
ncbi:hypothetical protein BDP81DRAFT_488001 [Colletotrichum phormii]|uniref:Uncharacterized protein n=1 Tax=Colletotrichum phormii TaxID=359342 RepID=A0AAJ0EPG5_9PEZI|nr:uncharacterized protein BDP81DRAFT_488001 [Colletotrichum phormii]KAK1656448.1 hypothetical protein BDP81DRAFT_488001 [Colletotrichum phormii]